MKTLNVKRIFVILMAFALNACAVVPYNYGYYPGRVAYSQYGTTYYNQGGYGAYSGNNYWGGQGYGNGYNNWHNH